MGKSGIFVFCFSKWCLDAKRNEIAVMRKEVSHNWRQIAVSAQKKDATEIEKYAWLYTFLQANTICNALFAFAYGTNPISNIHFRINTIDAIKSVNLLHFSLKKSVENVLVRVKESVEESGELHQREVNKLRAESKLLSEQKSTLSTQKEAEVEDLRRQLAESISRVSPSFTF